MNIWYLAAAILAGGTCLVHIVLGGRVAARPLLRDERLSSVARYTNYFCWHLVTLTLAAMAVGYAWAAYRPGGTDVAMLMTLLAAGFVAWNVAMIRLFGLRTVEHPQFVFFAPMIALGAAGFFA